jgi:lipoprotein-releasing system ATP-binding protein
VPLIELDHVHKTYLHHGKPIRVLADINLAVRRGESVAVMGASGVGKSTLLHIMGSLEPPTEGSVRFMGRDLYSLDEPGVCRLRNREIGFVFQFHHLLSEFSALEHTMIPALIGRISREAAQTMATRILNRVGLGHRLMHRPGELSGGEQQRVAIARALVMNPKLILADEPTGNLDWATGEEIAELLFDLNQDVSLTMVVATHNPKLAAGMSTQMEIVGGRIRV